MEYTTEVTIHLPRREAVRLFDSMDNTYRWQPGLKEITKIKGGDRSEGAVYRMVYEGRRSDLVVEESVVTRKLPEEYTTVIRSPGVVNTVQNLFLESAADTTRWRMVNHFQFRGLMKWMAPFMKQAFRNNTLLGMERFKMFAEREIHSTDTKR